MKCDRLDFDRKTKAQAFMRASGRCEECGARLMPGYIEYDHRIPCALGGDNSLENCRCICRTCHRLKTSRDDIPRIAKAKRVEMRHAGIRKPRTITRWRRFDGTPVYASRER